MFFKPVDLTTALRPSLLQDESLLFVQDAVGLYEGKYKIPNYQNGHAYLTSQRICFVSTSEPRRHSVAIDLKEIERIEYQAGFLRSSPKIIIYPKRSRRFPGPNLGLDVTTRSVSAPPQNTSSVSISGTVSPSPLPIDGGRPTVTWVCPICTYSNPIPSNFDPSTATTATPLPPCLACGIKPPLAVILKAAIASATHRDITSPTTSLFTSTRDCSGAKFSQEARSADEFIGPPSTTKGRTTACPRCTFANHPSLRECEICGAPLKPLGVAIPERADSPAPLFFTSELLNREITDSMKLSFRGGGEKVFNERLNDALIQRKWLLYDAPPVPQVPSAVDSNLMDGGKGTLSGTDEQSGQRGVGIAGLERRGFQTRKINETVIGNAFEDLEALMASAKDIVALAETLATEAGMKSNNPSSEADTVLSQSAAALGMITTKDMLSSGSSSENLYVSELSRNLAEYLTDDREGVLRREGGIMSLIDLWAVFNRRRNGVELVSPSDLHKAAELWEKLKLPVRLRRFKSGLLVVQPHDWTDERCIRLLELWLDELHSEPPPDEVPWDWATFGRGVTAQEAAQRFGWSVGVASEELEMAEDRGILCREEGIEGTRFWRNHIMGLESGAGLINTFEDLLRLSS